MSNNWNQLPSDQMVEKTAQSLTEHGFHTQVVANKSEALELIKQFIPEGAEVMTGSSTTLNQIGFSEYLEKGNHGWINLHATIGAENDDAKRNKLRRKSITADYFLASSNALTQDGIIVSADNTGSRVGAFPFGAGRLILIVGINKITTDLNEAMQRIREYVLPLESKRLQGLYGVPSNISKWVIMEKEIAPNRVEVILVKEVLGF